MTNFFIAPVSPEQLDGRFQIPKGVVTEENLATLARTINEAVEDDGSAVWLNPEKDGRGVHIHGRPVMFGGQALRFTQASDLAVFPKPRVPSEHHVQDRS